MSELKIEQRELKDLTFPKYNPRTMSEEDMQKLKNSITEFGYVEPIIINNYNNHIIGGNHRAKALQELGYETVDAIILHIKDLDKEKALNIALNRIVGGWDKELLEKTLKEIDLSTIDVNLTGFNNIELEDIEIELENYNQPYEPTVNNPTQKNKEVYYFSQEEIRQDIIDGWVTYDSIEDYIKNIIDIPTAKYQFNRLCQGYNDGYNISLIFNPHRLDTETIKSKSIFYGINHDESYKKTYAKLLSYSTGVMPTSQYYKHIDIGTAGYQYVNEFRPYLARDIYKHYCNDNSRILNQCAGWGGRLIGIASCMFTNIEYWETDPSTKTYKGLTELKKFLCLGDNYKQFNKPFEELELPKNYFDFAFTSPPYFDTEIYSENNDEFNLYNGYEKWLDNFMYPLIDRTMFALKPNKVCLLNIGNKTYDILTDTINYINERTNYIVRYTDKFNLNKEGLGNRANNDKGEKFIEIIKEE